MKYPNTSEMFMADMCRIIESMGVPADRCLEAWGFVTSTPPPPRMSTFDVVNERVAEWKRENL